MGIPILAASLAIFSGMFIVWLASWIMSRGRFVLPSGKVVEARFRDCRVALVFMPATLDRLSNAERAAIRCARALWATREAFRRQGRKLDKTSRFAVVHVASGPLYEATYDAEAAELYARAGYAGMCCSSNGSLWTAHARMGSGIAPLVAIRAEAFPATVETGALVIHEITHWLSRRTGNADLEHVAPWLWAPAPDSVEVRAAQIFYGAA